MTREEAIKVLNSYCSERYLADTSLQEACSVAVEALQAQADGDNVFKMRDATPKERESIDKYIKSISKPTGIDFDSLSDSQTIHHLTDKAYSELCLLAEKGREALQTNSDVRAIPSAEPCEDAISRQALLDDFGLSEKTRKYGGDHSGYNTMMLYEIQDVIESQPPVKPQEPKWIPVSERLPDKCDYKSCYEVEDGAVFWTNEEGLVGMGYYYESTKTWSDIEDNPVSVTAWMPLPEPYKAESEK